VARRRLHHSRHHPTPSRLRLQEHPVSHHHSTSTIHLGVILGPLTRCSRCREVGHECLRATRSDARDPSLSTWEPRLAGTQWQPPRTRSSEMMMTRASQLTHIRPSPSHPILLIRNKRHPLTSIITERHLLRVTTKTSTNLYNKTSTRLTDRHTASTKLDSNSMVSKGATTHLV